ncbi:MAG: hydrolase 2, exosortase A system-associated [Massilia sp.]|nr:hydrolase 2, exosortase A system-associated [Massilia sp.]
MAATDAARAAPFFLDTGMGQRFCLFHPPARQCLGAVIYVHPFAEEMNRARRMAAVQSRALAALGFGVLQLDLYGCGDSSGDFGDARWDIWKRDLAAASAWLTRRTGHPVKLWGLRLGALLALDYARDAQHDIAKLILWQPVPSGVAHLTQFLRLRMAGALLAQDDAGSGDHPGDTRAMRAALQAGAVLEVAGYDLAPALAGAIDNLDAADMVPPACAVHWFEALADAGRPVPPGASRVISAWQRQGVELHVHRVQCPPFWMTPGMAECPALLAATSALFQAQQ